MFHALRVLTAALLAMWLALPGKSGEGDGGENAGGTGVWILPRCETISSNAGNFTGLGAPRIPPFVISDLAHDLRLRMSSDCGPASALLFDGTVGLETELPVSGLTVTVPASVLQTMFSAGVASADIVVMDAAHKGYLMRLGIDLLTARGTLAVY